LINQLPEVQRIVFNMFVVEGYSHAEIEELTNIPESSSRVYLTRARKWLREKIEASEKEAELFIKYNH
jgi:RNA polymerase sigma-70 factor (ECF subfamily)